MRLLSVLLIALLLVTPCFAGALNEQDQEQGQAQGQLQGQAQGQLQGQAQGQAQAAIAAQGQLQGQIGKVSTDVSINEEDSDKAPDAVAFPTQGATEGVASANASYMFGNLGLSDTEMYKKGSHLIQTILAIPDDVIAKEEKSVLVKSVVAKMMKSIRPRRLLGIGPEQHSKNLINLFGLLSFDSVWAEGQKPFQKKQDAGL